MSLQILHRLPFVKALTDLFHSRPKCGFCHQTYYLDKTYAFISNEGHELTLSIADVQGGYGKGKAETIALPITREDLAILYPALADRSHITPSTQPFLDLTVKRAYERLLGSDPAEAWRRLRLLSTARFVHPPNRPPRDTGPEYLSNAQQLPRSVFSWAAPLFISMYAIGLSYREILWQLPQSPMVNKDTASHSSIIKAVKEGMARTVHMPGTSFQLTDLHHMNRRRIRCILEEVFLQSDEDSVTAWKLTVLDPVSSELLNWLEATCQYFHLSLLRHD